jgi:hypothetical protein
MHKAMTEVPFRLYGHVHVANAALAQIVLPAGATDGMISNHWLQEQW